MFSPHFLNETGEFLAGCRLYEVVHETEDDERPGQFQIRVRDLVIRWWHNELVGIVEIYILARF